MTKSVRTHRDLDVYQRSFEAAMNVFELSKFFPKVETYALTGQIRRSSRSVCANQAEAWRKRRYQVHFISKFSDAEAEAFEPQVWIQFAVKCAYLGRETGGAIFNAYDRIIATLVGMIIHPETWIIQRKK